MMRIVPLGPFCAPLVGFACEDAGLNKLIPHRVQCPIWLNASRIGSEEILSTPLNGVYISMMIKIAAETANAQITSATITVGLGGAKRPKPTKMATSHAT